MASNTILIFNCAFNTLSVSASDHSRSLRLLVPASLALALPPLQALVDAH